MDGCACILISFINTQHNNICSRIARPPQQRITTQQCVLIKEIKMMLTRLHAHTLTHMQQMQQHPTDLKVLQGVACVCCVIATRLTRVCVCVRLMNV